MQPSVTYSNQFRRMAFVSEWPCWQNSELYMSLSSSSNPQPATRTCGPRLHTHHYISASEIPVSAIGLLGLGLYASFKAIGADECMYATQIPHLGCPSLHDSEIPMHYWKKGFWQIILIARIYFSAQVVKKQKKPHPYAQYYHYLQIQLWMLVCWPWIRQGEPWSSMF